MPVKYNPSGPIPFLRDFSGYNETVEENISNMFSCNIMPPPQRVNVDYLVGSANLPIVANMVMENLTRNAQLTVKILYNKQIFRIEANAPSTVAPSGKDSIEIKLDPLQIKSFNVFVSSTLINSTYALERVLTDIELVVSFSPMGDLVKPGKAPTISRNTLPSTIQII